MRSRATPLYHSPSASMRLLLALLALALFATIMRWVELGKEHAILERMRTGDFPSNDAMMQETQDSDLRLARRGLIWLGSLALTCIATMGWLYRCTKNLKALGARDLTHSPAGAIWWWIAPLGCQVMPFLVTRQAWRASKEPRAWRQQKMGLLLPLWWTLWLVPMLLPFFSMGRQVSAGDITGAQSINEHLQLQSALLLCAGVAFAAVVLRITRAQENTESMEQKRIDELSEVFA